MDKFKAFVEKKYGDKKGHFLPTSKGAGMTKRVWPLIVVKTLEVT